jgi:hypothetical protein
MDMALKMGSFSELSEREIMMVDGGNWLVDGLRVVAGGFAIGVAAAAVTVIAFPAAATLAVAGGVSIALGVTGTGR